MHFGAVVADSPSPLSTPLFCRDSRERALLAAAVMSREAQQTTANSAEAAEALVADSSWYAGKYAGKAMEAISTKAKVTAQSLRDEAESKGILNLFDPNAPRSDEGDEIDVQPKWFRASAR